MQTYRPIEAVVVDDGHPPVSQRALRQEIGEAINIRVVRLNSRLSIGGKRNVGVRAARGAIIMHWDDDDMHSHLHVATLACPILNNISDITVLTFSYLARLSTGGVDFFDYRQGRQTKVRSATGPFLGSLAYARRVAISVSSASSTTAAGIAPFAPHSLSEDLHFVERAIAGCHRMLPISGAAAQIVYTRHAETSRMRNTWRPKDYAQKLSGPTIKPPAFVSAQLQQQYVQAEVEAAKLGACKALARKEPPDLRRPLRFPYNPSSCCRGRRAKLMAFRPCTDSVDGSGTGCTPGETFCGASKGVCTSSCTCEGEPAHGISGRAACGPLCCKYWHGFWRRHPENCTSHQRRPLKTTYCGAKAKRGHPQQRRTRALPSLSAVLARGGTRPGYDHDSD